MFSADPKKPIGGNIMAHASTTRLYLRKVTQLAISHLILPLCLKWIDIIYDLFCRNVVFRELR